MIANIILRCAVCRERVRARHAVYPVPDGGPCHPACADRYWQAVADVCNRRPT